MIVTIKMMAGRWGRCVRWARPAALLSLVVCIAAPAFGFMDVENPVIDRGYNPNGIFVLDGSFVMNVGEVQINITNWGLIGSTFSINRPWSDAPSCQWPAGSGHEYLWSAGLWVGGVVLGERLCSTGGWGSEFYPLDEIEYTIYEAIGSKVLRPAGNPDASGKRVPQPGPDDDGDGMIDEETLNGFDDDGDGEIDEDFGQIGNQMFVLTNYDNTRLAQENFPDHTPMNLEVVQTSFQWENDTVDDFVGFDYRITNIGVTPVEKVYIGFFADSDIGPRGTGAADDDMAGSWPALKGSPGMVRASDGKFVPLQVGYMFDAPEEDSGVTAVDGYFGIVFLGHAVDPSGRFAPQSVSMRTFQSFSGSTAFEQGGDPSNDDERYQLLSAELEDWDADTPDGKQADFRFLVSAGPFLELPPGQTLDFQVGMVVGPGLGNSEGAEGLLSHCADAALTWYGIYTDEFTVAETLDHTVFNPGQGGRETMLCKSWFDQPAGNPWDTFTPDFMDASCLDADFIANAAVLTVSDKFEIEIDGEREECAMFNMDNCFECARQLGRLCESGDFTMAGQWSCNKPNPESTVGCTGVDGLETQVHWLVGMAPPPPGLRLWSTDSRVHVFWDDRSQITQDIRTRALDFESYRIWRADNWERPFGSSVINGPESSRWQMIAEYDLINDYITYISVDNVTYLDTIPLGENTGLEVVSYDPISLTDPAYDGLMEAMTDIVMEDTMGLLRVRPDVRGSDGVPLYPALVPWESEPAVLDTFFAVIERPAGGDTIAKHSTRYYEYVDREIHNGFLYFYSVTATDHELLPEDNPNNINLPIGAGLAGDPGSSFDSTVPGTKAQTAEDRAANGVNIYVFPNPATRDALAEYQELLPNGDDPTGVRVTFTNLPRAHNIVNIYTVSGDLVQTIAHDGSTGTGHVSWNLMSRNGQEIVSGIYLYAVQSDDDRFEDFVGKFVVVR